MFPDLFVEQFGLWVLSLLQICWCQIVLGLGHIGVILAKLGLVNLQCTLIIPKSEIEYKLHIPVSALPPQYFLISYNFGTAHQHHDQCDHHSMIIVTETILMLLVSHLSTSSYLPWFWQSRARLLSCLATSGWSDLYFCYYFLYIRVNVYPWNMKFWKLNLSGVRSIGHTQALSLGSLRHACKEAQHPEYVCHKILF